MPLKIYKWDDSILKSVNKTAYVLDSSKYTTLRFKGNLDPIFSWTVPFVTGHKYKLSWGFANDFDSMSIQTSVY